jgi:25S rRNA (adenine2142-N1)-methyltransferase
VPATAATAADTRRTDSPPDGADGDDHRLALLDVGALAANYTGEAAWISARAIDLNAQTPAVARVDFFDEPLSRQLGVLSLCLVLNFVGDPRRAGQMLWKASAHLKPGGLLAVMVPRACIDNSRYCTDSLFQQALETAGFEVAVVDHSARLARYLARRRTTGLHEGTCPVTLPKGLDKRTVVRSGGQRNNFCILLEPRWPVPGASGAAS